jgi:hypothetical protein
MNNSDRTEKLIHLEFEDMGHDEVTVMAGLAEVMRFAQDDLGIDEGGAQRVVTWLAQYYGVVHE